MSHESMTVDELSALILEKSNAIDEAKNELRALCRVRDHKARLAEVERVVGGLGAEERAQLVSALGITSAEKLGTLGS